MNEVIPILQSCWLSSGSNVELDRVFWYINPLTSGVPLLPYLRVYFLYRVETSYRSGYMLPGTNKYST